MDAFNLQVLHNILIVVLCGKQCLLNMPSWIPGYDRGGERIVKLSETCLSYLGVGDVISRGQRRSRESPARRANRPNHRPSSTIPETDRI